MLINLLHAELHQALLEAQNSPYWARAKKLLLVMLGLWMSYFLLVNWFQLLTQDETRHLFEGHNGRGHGGPFESAAVWSFAPESVDTDDVPDLPPRASLATDRQHVLVESYPTP